MLNTKQNYKIEIMLYNYENGIKKQVQGAKTIYTFSSLTTYKYEIKSTFFSVSIKDVIYLINKK